MGQGEALTTEHTHYGEPCDCADAMRRIEQRKIDDRRAEAASYDGPERRESDRRAS